MSQSAFYEKKMFSEAFGEPYLFLPSKVAARGCGEE